MRRVIDESVLERYELSLRREGATPKAYTLKGRLPTRMDALNHCLFMLPKIVEKLRDGEAQMAISMLGWVEGILWSHHIVTYDELPFGS